MRKIHSDVSIDAIACCFRSGIAEMAGISSRRGHGCAFTYNYVKTHLEQTTPHDLSATQSEAPLSECVVIDVTKCGFQSGIGEMAGILSCWKNDTACGFQSGIAEMAGDFQADTTYSVAKKLWLC